MRIPKRINSKGVLLYIFKVIVLVAMYVVISVYTVPVYATVKTYVGERLMANTKIIILGETSLTIEVADTYEKRKQGLSGREELRPNSGMFFVFDEPDKYGIWMKDMKFDIDIIWLNAMGEIIFIKENVKPETYPETFAPDKPALFVLEVPAGFVKEKHLKFGDKIDFY